MLVFENKGRCIRTGVTPKQPTEQTDDASRPRLEKSDPDILSVTDLFGSTAASGRAQVHGSCCVPSHLLLLLHLPPFLHLLSRCKEQSVIGWEQIWFKRLPLKSQPVGFKTHSPASPLTVKPSAATAVPTTTATTTTTTIPSPPPSSLGLR